MTVGQLKALIEDMPDECRVYYENLGDHDAAELDFRDGFITEEYNDKGVCTYRYQYFGDEYLYGDQKAVRALVTGG